MASSVPVASRIVRQLSTSSYVRRRNGETLSLCLSRSWNSHEIILSDRRRSKRGNGTRQTGRAKLSRCKWAERPSEKLLDASWRLYRSFIEKLAWPRDCSILCSILCSALCSPSPAKPSRGFEGFLESLHFISDCLNSRRSSTRREQEAERKIRVADTFRAEPNA